MITTLINTLLESAPYIVIGFLIAGAIRIWVPTNILQHHLGGRSRETLFKSVGIGAILPLCSCGTIPLGVGLYRSGAAVGNILAFMTSTPILSPVLIALSLNLLGWKLTATLVASAVIGSLITGHIGNRLFKERDRCKKEEKQFSATERKSKNRVVETIRWSLAELGTDVSVDIFIGLGIAALIIHGLPMEWISSWLGQQDLLTLIYVIILGIPVYACSVPSIPVVQGLLLLGASPGAAIAYMIAGPATNLGELNAIRKSMGSKPALFYAAALITIALISGAVTDQLIFPDYQYHAFRVEGELVVQQCCVPPIFGNSVGDPSITYTAPIWHWPFGITLAAMIIYGVIKKTRYLFINPCTACNWQKYGKNGSCGSNCHIKRKYRFINHYFCKKDYQQ